MEDAKVTIPKAVGRCLCGAVSVELTNAKPLIDVCHCSMCRQWGGGPFMGVSGDAFTLQGQGDITAYTSSQWAQRGFCSVCGSNLFYRFVPADHYSFCAGLFDLGETAAMEKQIFIDEKPGFYDFSQDTPMQTGEQTIAEALAAGFTFPDQAESE